MTYIPFWLSIVVLFLLFILWAAFSHNPKNIRIISSWWFGFYLATVLITLANSYGISNKLPMTTYDEEYSYRYTEKNCFLFFDCRKTGYSTRKKSTLHVDEIAHEASELDLYILMLSLVVTIFIIKILIFNYKYNSLRDSIVTTYISFVSTGGIITLFYAVELYYIFFSIILGSLLAVPTFIVFFYNNNKEGV